MKRSTGLILVFILLLQLSGRTDEGMWLPFLIQEKCYNKMKEKGLALSAEEIYSINNASLKDAVGGLNSVDRKLRFFCTGEIISPEGLMLTNHHCGYESIQSHSSVEHDYLENGFWAETKADELPNEGICVSFVVRMEDVSGKIIPELNDTMSESDRESKVSELTEKIEENATLGNHYDARVYEMYGGNNFYLVVYETFEDVRLVGAPPSSIGKFGHDTDNWMWPRHTGDFCLFRVYTGPDGKPAPYSEDNIPLKAKHHFPVSLKGIEEGEFTMVMGFPGTTQRYMTSFGIKQTMDQTNPVRVKIRTVKQDIWKEDMEADKEVKIQYAAKYSQSSNYWKYSIGQNKALKRLHIYEERKKLEKQFLEWIDENEERKEKYGEALDVIREVYEESATINLVDQYINEIFFSGIEIVEIASQIMPLYNTLTRESDSLMKIKRLTDQLKESGKEFYKNYNPPTDKKVLIALMKMYYEDIPEDYRPDIYETITEEYEGYLSLFADSLFENSIFVDQEKFFHFLDKPAPDIVFDKFNILMVPMKTYTLYQLLKNYPDSTHYIKKEVEELRENAEDLYKNYDLNAERNYFKTMFDRLYNDAAPEDKPSFYKTIEEDYKGDFTKYLDDLYSKSIFSSKEEFLDFLEKPKLKTIEKDIGFNLMNSVYDELKQVQLRNDPAFEIFRSIIPVYSKLYFGSYQSDVKLEKARRIFIKGLREMQEDQKFYPDANSTLRLTYGTVGDYKPMDAVYYDYYTTVKGIMQKEDPNNPEFVVPDKLKALYNEKDFGRYGNNGKMWVCFTTDNDITGGNSGSPVLNANGELVGTAFDGNWEAMSSDIAFEPSLQKCINVDIRYVLFVIDKYAGATHLIDEMTIIQ